MRTSKTEEALQFAAGRLCAFVSEDMWPIAMVFYSPSKRGLQVAMLPHSAGLIKGQGAQLSAILEEAADQFLKRDTHAS